MHSLIIMETMRFTLKICLMAWVLCLVHCREHGHTISNHKRELYASSRARSLIHSAAFHLTSSLQKRSTSSQCPLKFDIILLVDGSRSIAYYGHRETQDSNYYKNKIYPLLGDLIKKFNISEDKVHLGLLFFGEKNLEEEVLKKGYSFSIDKFRDANQMIDYINKLTPPSFAATYVADAMKKAESMLEESKRHAEDDVGKAIIFITDGKPHDTIQANQTVDMLRQKNGVNFVTFAIGEDADYKLLKEWASGPPTEKLFFSSTFKDPNPAKLLETMSQKFCTNAVVVPNPECSLKFDILVIVDGSASVTHYGKQATGDGDYYKNKVYNLIKNIMALFKLGENKVEIGLLFFGSNDIQSIKNKGYYFDIGQYEDVIAMKNFIDTLPPPLFPATYVDKAMIEAGNMFKKSKRYSDKTVGKAIIFITDGAPTNKAAANKTVEELKTSEGVNLITFGIGGKTDAELLKAWASGPPDKKLYFNSSFDDSAPADLIEKIGKEFCETAVIVPTPASNCSIKFDVLLVVDASASVHYYGRKKANDPEYFKNNIYELIKDIVNDFDLGPDKVQFGLLFFGDKNVNSIKDKNYYFDVGKYQDATAMKSYLDTLPVPRFSATYVAPALKEANSMLQKSKRFKDKTVGKAIIFITDGEPTDKSAADEEVNNLKKFDSINFVTYGIGNGVNSTQLKDWASGPSNEKLFYSASFKNPNPSVLIKKLGKEFCETAVVNPSPNFDTTDGEAKCKNYTGCSMCWLFDQEKNGQVIDYVTKRYGVLTYGATIVDKQDAKGPFLTLTNPDQNKYGKGNYPWVDLGDFKGTCISDPDLCSDGLTVMFWIRITANMIESMLNYGMTHQYIMSSGGQKSKSRGFVLLYQKDAKFEGFKLQVQAKSSDYLVEFRSLPTSWSHIAFTWENTGELAFYFNGQKYGDVGAPLSGSFPDDEQTYLTLGKPNYGTKYFGRFQMNSLIFFNKTLTVQEINNLFTRVRGSYPSNQGNQGGGVAGGGSGLIATTTIELGASYTISIDVYHRAAFFWAFKTMFALSGGGFVSYLQLPSQGGFKKDYKYNAVMKGGAKLTGSIARGKVLLLESFGAYADFGNFENTCVSDPDLCAGQNRFSYSGMKGLSVSFWLKITEDDVRVNPGDKNQQHQYIISSGGQVPDSRGFSFLYAAEQNKFKLQLQTKKYIYTIELDDLEQTWIHFAFTWKVDGQLILYINGELKESKDKEDRKHDTDAQTRLTVGKPNHVDKHYGRFKMDLLSIYYYVLTETEIRTLWDNGKGNAEGPGIKTTATPAVTTLSPLPTSQPVPVTSSTTNTTTTTLTPTTSSDDTLTTPMPTTTEEPDATTPTGQPTQPAATTTSVPTDSQGKCNVTNFDMVVVIDNSGSIEAYGHTGYFDKVKMFVKKIISTFEIGNGGNVAIIEASADTTVIAKFGDIEDKDSFNEYIDKMQSKKERSFLGKALEVVRTDVFAQSYCRKSAKIMLIITDGYSSDDVVLPAVELRDMGVAMLGIGFGQDTPLMRYTLESMSSDPKDQYAFLFAYDRLVESAKDISNRACLATVEASLVDDTESVNKKDVKGGVDDDFKELFLLEANKYRRIHSAVSLSWSVELTRKAQQWAEYLAEKDELLTRPKVHYGQALHISSDSGTDAARISVQAWYNQIIYFDFQKPRITDQNSYFIQLVWRSTREVGVGAYESSTGKTYVVAFYSPPGNTDNGIKFNVLPITSSAVTDGTAGICPSGYQPSTYYCYKFYSNTVTWAEAVATCSAQKGSLVSVTTDEEQSFVNNNLNQNNVKVSWSGLNDRLNQGSFNWVDGAPLSYNGWKTPPRKGSSNNCVEVTTDLGWEDAMCEKKNPFICKMIQPADIVFMVTIHYPTESWTTDLVLLQGNSKSATEMIQRVDRLITTVYQNKDWFQGHTVTAFRGHVSVFMDIEIRFTAAAPLDPIEPLKDVTYTEDCNGFICDLTDIQIIPAINITYNGTCTASCYTSCTPNCLPACCSPQTVPNYYTYEVVQVDDSQPTIPQPPVVVQPTPTTTVSMTSTRGNAISDQINPQTNCAYECTHYCLDGCPPQCCINSASASKREGILLKKLSHRRRV